MVGYYNQVKEYLAMYAKIPGMIKEKIFEIIWGIWNREEEDDEELIEVKKEKKKKKK